MDPTGARTSSSVDDLLLAALERGGESMETGRYLVTFKESSAQEGIRYLGEQGLRLADARDFKDQPAVAEAAGDADAMVFPEIGVALLGGEAAMQHNMGMNVAMAADSPIEAIEPEYFVYPVAQETEYVEAFRRAAGSGRDAFEYLRGFARAADTIARDLRGIKIFVPDEEDEEEGAAVLGATWGINACRAARSTRSGAGIRIAVLDTGFDLGHPDFTGRPLISQTFVGQPVQDLNGHGTHCIGTASGPRAPAGSTPRYGVAFASRIHVGKVLSNSGWSVGGSVLAGMNWAIANRCEIISMSLGSQAPVQAAYTAAGNAALGLGLLIIAAAGNANGSPTGAPANSPSIMAVASLDSNLAPSSFSNRGKIEIAAPGRDVFSSWPRPRRYHTISGTSMATPHVAGCAALWAQTSASLRGVNLWRKLQATARRLPYPATVVGAGLVQAPA